VKTVRSLLPLAALLAALGAAAPANAVTVTATPPIGPVTGVVTPAFDEFLGIPYAEAPVGALRWQPPEPHAPWSTPLDASAFGNRCAQIASPFGLPSTSEDCLFLNVYTPRHGSVPARDLTRQRPVMVWIHGGAFQVGSAEDYDPTRMIATGDVVVVTVNYRLGVLGFLAHPALSAESADGISGNYGILDQQLALKWVRDNIASFGGNPRRVTIFGESAGGISVHAQLVSPGAAGLFRRAIVESGAINTQPALADAEATGTDQANTYGCTDQSATCLRALTVDQILAGQGTSLSAATPVIDGVVLPMPFLQAFKSGTFNRVPIIEGSNHDEMRLFVALLFEIPNGPLTDAQYPGAISALLGVSAAQASQLALVYPTSHYSSPGVALGTLGTDAAFACGARGVDKAVSAYVPTYAYEFDDTNAPQRFLPAVSFPYGAYHASEVQYLWDIPYEIPAPALDADQMQLADSMVKYWTRFARTGKPRAPRTSRWKPFDNTTGFMLSLIPPSPGPINGGSFGADHRCSFWDPILGN